MNKQHLSELDYYFRVYWETQSTIKKQYNIKFPEVETNTSLIPKNSVFALLFNTGFSEIDYISTFKPIEGPKYSYFSIPIRERLQFNADYISSLISDTTGSQILVSTNNEISLMLNLLLNYRINGVTDLSLVNYNELDSNLSKLIYVYLDSIINNNYELIKSEIPISDSTELLDNLFELYVVNEVYKVAQNDEKLIGNKTIKTRPGRSRILVDTTIFNQKYLSTKEKAYNTNDFWLFRNGYFKDRNMYNVEDSSTYTIVKWENKELDKEVREGDTIIVDYYIEVSKE